MSSALALVVLAHDGDMPMSLVLVPLLRKRKSKALSWTWKVAPDEQADC